MIANWNSSALASLCTYFGDGDWIESKDQSPEGVRLVQTGNVGQGDFKDRAEKARYVSEETFSRLRCTEIFAGDCLISRLPDPPGRACLIPDLAERMITAVDCSIVRFDQDKVLPEYFVYYSQTSDYLAAIEREATGTTRKRISRARLGQVPVPIAPLAEQRRIVTLLDEAFEGIATAKAHAEQNLRNATSLLTQHLLSTFDALDVAPQPVASLAKCSLGKMLDKAKNQGLPQRYLRNLNVRWFEFDLDDVQEMKFTAEEIDKYTVRKGDLVICEGGYPGRCAIWDADEPIYFQKALHRARFHEPMLAQWLQYFLFAQDASGRLSQHFTGTGIQHFTGAALSKLQVPVPSLDVIQKLLGSFEELRVEGQRLASIYQRKLTALTELQQSLLHQAFTGQL